MRPPNKQRSRNKPGNNGQRRHIGNIINRVFESAGPDGKVRGTPQQIIEKYNVLARDAQLSGDRVAAENFLQHAEHYSRLLGEAQRQIAEQRQQPDREFRDDGFGRDEMPGDGFRPPRAMQPVPAGEASGLVTVEHDALADPRGPAEQADPAEEAEVAVSETEGNEAADATDEMARPQGSGRRSRSRRRPRSDEAAVAESPAE